MQKLSSDHNPLLMQFDTSMPVWENSNNCIPDWNKFAENLLRNFPPLSEINTTLKLEEAVENIAKNIKEAEENSYKKTS